MHAEYLISTCLSAFTLQFSFKLIILWLLCILGMCCECNFTPDFVWILKKPCRNLMYLRRIFEVKELEKGKNYIREIFLVYFRQYCYLVTYVLNYILTFFMQQSPSWEANQFSASKEIPRILWNVKVHYHIYICLSPFPIPSQINPVHARTSHFLKIHLNIIHPSMPGSSKWPLSLRFPHQIPIYTPLLPHTCYSPAHLILLDLITCILVSSTDY